MTPDRPTGPATLRWTNEHGETFREVVWTDPNGRKWKTGVQEEAALAIEARILAALPAALERALPDHTKAIGFDHAASSCGAGCAAALAAAIEKELE